MIFLLLAIIACIVPLVLFLARAVYVRGWKNEAGRAVMVVATVALIAFTFALARVFGYQSPGWVRAAVYVVIATALWWQYLTFEHVQRTGVRRERRRIEREDLRQSR